MPAMVTSAQRIYTRCCHDLRRRVCPGARMLLYRLHSKVPECEQGPGDVDEVGRAQLDDVAQPELTLGGDTA